MIHPKKGSPSGRNAYPVTEKMEELKEEEKNDMAKKKTFEEYTQEALYEIEKTEAALKQAKLEKEQAEHRIQRSLNYLDTQKKKKRKARTHLLIQKGAAIEAICKDCILRSPAVANAFWNGRFAVHNGRPLLVD